SSEAEWSGTSRRRWRSAGSLLDDNEPEGTVELAPTMDPSRPSLTRGRGDQQVVTATLRIERETVLWGDETPWPARSAHVHPRELDATAEVIEEVVDTRAAGTMPARKPSLDGQGTWPHRPLRGLRSLTPQAVAAGLGGKRTSSSCCGPSNFTPRSPGAP